MILEMQPKVGLIPEKKGEGGGLFEDLIRSWI